MNNVNRTNHLAPLLGAGMLALLLTAAGPAAAQSSKHHTKARSGANQSQCVGGGTWQDRQTCQKEAAAAKQAAQRHNLSSGSDETFMKNRLARCQALPPADRDACSARMAHPTEVEGSVTGGGVLYQYAETAPTGGAAADQQRPARDMMQRPAPSQQRGMMPRATTPSRTMPQQPRMN